MTTARSLSEVLRRCCKVCSLVKHFKSPHRVAACWTSCRPDGIVTHTMISGTKPDTNRQQHTQGKMRQFAYRLEQTRHSATAAPGFEQRQQPSDGSLGYAQRCSTLNADLSCLACPPSTVRGSNERLKGGVMMTYASGYEHGCMCRSAQLPSGRYCSSPQVQYTAVTDMQS